jgi:hypothetical protein
MSQEIFVEEVMRFVDNKDGTVTDTTTRLTWQQSDDGIRRTWKEAQDYAESLGGGWRLPTVEELFLLADRSKSNPAIDPIFQCRSYYYWSSSTYAYYPDYAWFVDFGYGYAHWDYKSNANYYVRCARGDH